MRWFRRRNSDEALKAQLADAEQVLKKTERQELKVTRITDKLRQHYDDNQFAARIVQHLAEGR